MGSDQFRPALDLINLNVYRGREGLSAATIIIYTLYATAVRGAIAAFSGAELGGARLLSLSQIADQTGGKRISSGYGDARSWLRNLAV